MLVTGLSGTGKSSALDELERRGYRVVETDLPPWCEWIPPTDGAPPQARVVGEVLQPPGGDETDRSHPLAVRPPGGRQRRLLRRPQAGAVAHP